MRYPEYPYYITLREAQRRLGCPYRALQAGRDLGEIKVYQVGKRWQRVSWKDAQAWWKSKAP